MLAASMNQAMERTLAQTGRLRNVILLGAGSEESVERSEVRNGLEQIIACFNSRNPSNYGKAYNIS